MRQIFSHSPRNQLSLISARVAAVTVSPPVSGPNTDAVTMRIDVPINENSWVAPFFFKDMTVSTAMTMKRERFGTSTVP
jgi:hypothetical protein